MTNYHFQTEDFGISDEGIHLLRDRFNYRTIAFADLRTFTIRKEKLTRNWSFVLVIGIIILFLGLAMAATTIKFLLHKPPLVTLSGKLYTFVLPLIGGYLVNMSLRIGYVLIIHDKEGMTERLELTEIVNAKKLSQLEKFIGSQCGGKSIY